MSIHRFQLSAHQQACFAESPLQAIVFEPAGVLYDSTPRRRWVWQLVTRLGLRISYDELFRSWDDEFLPPVYRGERRYADALHAFFASLELSAADLSELEAAVPLRTQPLEEGLRPLPGAVKILNRLSNEGLRSTVLSDCPWPGSELKEQLDGLGLGGQFGLVLTSADLGTVKPARQNYDAVTAALGLSRQQCAIVSARTSDLAGARECGWRTIVCGVEKIEADAAIASIVQLMEVTSSWNGRRQRIAS